MLSHNFPPDIDPNIYSLSAFVIGAILTEELDINEQNSIGNWLMLLGQYIVTYASQQSLINNRLNKRNNTNKYDVDFLLKNIQKIEQELNNLKKTSPWSLFSCEIVISTYAIFTSSYVKVERRKSWIIITVHIKKHFKLLLRTQDHKDVVVLKDKWLVRLAQPPQYKKPNYYHF